MPTSLELEREPAPRLETRRTPARSETKLAIEYCELGNYERVARGLVEAVRGEFLGSRIAAEVRPASGGVFEVAVGGKLVFSKKATARLPEPEEIFYHVQASLCCHPPGPPEGGGSV